ncbi:hypothetical protein C1H46_026503 [Malus baccata]|uniref:Uncharacterized protein n=1 Tax=Malus baccata TaxID=106549 RepID=A0A540LNP3_MALBA|nr:hypothetical protein C1H46_026503 [Malus baccata]
MCHTLQGSCSVFQPWIKRRYGPIKKRTSIGCSQSHTLMSTQASTPSLAIPRSMVSLNFKHTHLILRVGKLRNLPTVYIEFVDVNVKKVAGFEQPIRACCGQGGEYNNQIYYGGKVMVDGKGMQRPFTVGELGWISLHSSS